MKCGKLFVKSTQYGLNDYDNNIAKKKKYTE